MPTLPPASGPYPGLNPSALDIIKSSMRLIGALASGEEPDGNEGPDALAIYNQMVDDWDAERNMAYTINILNFPLTSGKQSYELGTNGDFNVQRPARIERAGIILLNNPAQPLELPIELLDDEGWAAIPVKNISSTVPLSMYPDDGFPFNTLSFWPIPTVPMQVNLYAWNNNLKAMTLKDIIVGPPSYIKTLKYCLAVDLAPEMGMTIPQEVATQAIMGRAKIKTMNQPELRLRIDPAISGRGGHYDFRSDEVK
jgi:hypothetical protein